MKAAQKKPASPWPEPMLVLDFTRPPPSQQPRKPIEFPEVGDLHLDPRTGLRLEEAKR